ncbi:AMP-dependent synthetase and ligase [Pelodictyon phaeoclathratiforme BU-1]|jgi:long-chain acyl-CoA synthetase|uniref:AMP-dependent synthetase and ligase n=2 Tax=Pelodictyon phaeoclathratiforme TaxID=34090 RepID=B4SGZ1_PELPB|nr:AMP-dependent synthetase and ligase [Pelodictyon phaeoclathratiforme BU-1]
MTKTAMSAKPWIRHYDKGVPHTLHPYPEETLVDVLHRSAVEQPLQPALYFKGAALSYVEMERQSDALAGALLLLGIGKGDRVALIMPNSPQLLISEFGVWKAGAIAVPMNPLYTVNELEHALNECGAETVIVLTPFYEKIKAAQTVSRLKRVIATNIKEYLSPINKLLFTLVKEKKDGHRVKLHKGDHWLAALLAAQSGVKFTPVAIKFDDPAIFLFSGGTTGNPKCVVISHQAMVMTGMQIASWFSVILEKGKDIILLNMPLFHVYAQVGILTAALIERYPVALVPNPRDIDDLLHTIKSLKTAVLPGVPTLFTALLNHPKVKRDSSMLKSLKLSVSGAAPLMLETKRRFEELTGGRIIDAYSLTESALASVFTPILGTYKHGSVGIPIPDVEIRIVDPETGFETLPELEIGEIIMRAPQLMKEYWQNPMETALVLRDGWLYTGDLGYLDEDGYLFIVDRKKDVIKPGGFQVWPRDVEEAIAVHPAVLEVGVAGVPDPYQGEAVKAWVVLRPGHLLSVDELREHCRKDLAAYKVPKHVEFIIALPKSTVGKVLRRKLVEAHLAEAAA